MRKLLILPLLALVTVSTPTGATSAAPTCAPGETVTITGAVGKDLEGGFVLEPFEVTEEVTEISIDAGQQASAEPPAAGNTLDFGTRGPGPDAFRGWNAPRATFSDESATRSYHRGPISAGTWYIEVGVAAIVEGTTSSYTVDVTCSDRTTTKTPWATLMPPQAAVTEEPGWYAGDLHVHSIDSWDAEDEATVPNIVDAAEEAGLDFVSLTDHNTDGHLDDLGDHQRAARDQDLLLIPGTEVTTYKGHMNWHGGDAQFLEYRTGPVWIRDPETGELDPYRPERSINEVLFEAKQMGALTQVNHPTQFDDPVSSKLCRGCAWDYPETDWGFVDLLEIQTGPPGWNQPPPGFPVPEALGPNPFTVTAIRMWEDLLAEGQRITAVGVSDDHTGGNPDTFVRSGVGTSATVVFADELSQQAILEALDAGRAYVRFWGPEGPHIELEAADGTIMGGTVDEPVTTMTARVEDGPPGQLLRVVHDGAIVAQVPVVGDPFEFTFPAFGPGWWRVETVVGTSYQALSNPIFFESPLSD